ncbi:hypothetical protein [Brevundimonas sp.]|uniref:hypothetical protein n=1 Tax=Brevundimonas sp. TaxID=1871086 RepID=UPI001A2AA939|nr:hypothetical protein [Brevundimonas sp.]MBJ7486340.1 hypothetical protein [Brevundimonas sp.]
MTRWLISLGLAMMIATVTGLNASACSPPPGPDWEGWTEGDEDIFTGRVTSLTPLPVSTEHGFDLRRATISIERLRSFENRSGPASIDAEIIVEVFDPGPRASALCLYAQAYRPGDTVLVIQSAGDTPRLFHGEWAAGSRFAPLFEKQQTLPK